MNKVRKLQLCNWLLLIITIVVLVSSIMLEATSSRYIVLVISHIIIASIFCALVVWHIYLNLHSGNWFRKFSKIKSPVTRILWWLFLITVLSAIVALVHWLGTYAHSPVGGVHGKIGFLMIAVAIGHTIKRIKFFRPRSPRR